MPPVNMPALPSGDAAESLVMACVDERETAVLRLAHGLVDAGGPITRRPDVDGPNRRQGLAIRHSGHTDRLALGGSDRERRTRRVNIKP